MTTDEIMALADAYGDRRVAVQDGARPLNVSEYRAALRAEVEQIVRSLSAWEQVWEGIRDNHEPNLNPTNKPLAVAAIFQLAINRVARAEAELEFKAALVHELLPYQERAVKAEAERDALRALLVEAREQLQYVEDGTAPWTKTLRMTVWGGMTRELLARIDAALKERA